MKKTIKKILIFLLTGLLVLAATACTPPEEEPMVEESSSTSQPDIQPPAEPEAPAEPVLLLGRNLATCGLGLEFDDPQLCDPNRPELASAQVFGATHLAPNDVNGLFSSFHGFCERPEAVGGVTIANVLIFSSFDTPEFKQLVEAGEWTFADPDSVFFEHNGHFYMEARDWQEGFLCIILQSFSVEELAQPNAEIRVGNRRFTPEQLEENVVYENDSWRVYAFTTALCNDGDYDFVEHIREWAEERETAEPYSGEWSYTDTEYDYSWIAPTVKHLQQNIGSYIFERNSTTENN